MHSIILYQVDKNKPRFKMNEFNNPKAIGGILIFVLLISWMGYMSYKKIQLSKDHRYTVGHTMNGRSTHKGYTIDYYFIVSEKRYEASRYPENKVINERDGRYFLEFLPSDPTVNRILWDQPVPDHITEAPPEGWAEIPK